MKNHLFRPVIVVCCIIFAAILARAILVPADFGIQERGYMYGWHRKSNEQEWKTLQTRYKTSAGCPQCHPDKLAELSSSPHAMISCENCHGPAYDHPEDPSSYTIDRSRTLCLRCHAKLPYPDSARGSIIGINAETHHTGAKCVLCHIPHHPEPMNQRQERTP